MVAARRNHQFITRALSFHVLRQEAASAKSFERLHRLHAAERRKQKAPPRPRAHSYSEQNVSVIPYKYVQVVPVNIRLRLVVVHTCCSTPARSSFSFSRPCGSGGVPGRGLAGRPRSGLTRPFYRSLRKCRDPRSLRAWRVTGAFSDRQSLLSSQDVTEDASNGSRPTGPDIAHHSIYRACAVRASSSLEDRLIGSRVGYLTMTDAVGGRS